MARYEEVVTKIVLFGKSKVGKTLLINSFHPIPPHFSENITSIYTHEWKQQLVSHKIQMWDTSDCPSLEKLYPILLHDAKIIILVCDSGVEDSLAYLNKYVTEIENRELSSKVIVVEHNLTTPKKLLHNAVKTYADLIGAEYIMMDSMRDRKSDSFISFLTRKTENLHKSRMVNPVKVEEPVHTNTQSKKPSSPTSEASPTESELSE